MFKKIYNFFDKLEDKVRTKLSHYPIIYAFLTGAGIILFWRGIWHAADSTPFLENSYVSIIVGGILLLLIGTLVSSFIGNEVIISGIKKEKKSVEKIVEAEEQDLMHEFEDDQRIVRELVEMKSQISEIKKVLEEIKNKK
jgi:hypothetical protein